MASVQTVVTMFEAVTANLKRDRDDLNALDKDDGDTGDNMVANFELVTSVLSQLLGSKAAPAAPKASGQAPDLGAALREAATRLRSEGRGGTAPIYAGGLDEAGVRLTGKQEFSAEDLLPLLDGLLKGSQRESTNQEGEGSLIDVLIPGIGGFVTARQEGASNGEALLEALLKLRRSANRTAQASQGHGKAKARNTQGEVDPGAAGTASVLEGLFGTLLEAAISSQREPDAAPRRTPEKSGIDLMDLAGMLLSSRDRG